MKKNSRKTFCIIIVIGLTIWNTIYIRNLNEDPFFPKFEYDKSQIGLVLKPSVYKPVNDTSIVPEIRLSSLNDNYVITSIKIRYFVNDSLVFIRDSLAQKECRFNAIDYDFIASCFTISKFKYRSIITRFPFVLEIQYVKSNGRGKQRRAYLFEYLQHDRQFLGIKYIEKIAVHKSRNKKFLMKLHNRQINLWKEEEKDYGVVNITVSEQDPNCVVNSTFSFYYYGE